MSWLSAAVGKATGGLIGDKQDPFAQFGGGSAPARPTIGGVVQSTVQQGLTGVIDAAKAAAAKAAADAAARGAQTLQEMASGLPGNSQPITSSQVLPSLTSPVGLLILFAIGYLAFKQDGDS